MRFLPQLNQGLAQAHVASLARLRKVYTNISFGQSTDNKDFGQNIAGQWATGTSPASPNTEFSIDMTLGYIPVGFDVKRINANAIFYDSGTTWTADKIFLKCSAASVMYTLFIH